jgi:S1-C subfamily serine protease
MAEDGERMTYRDVKPTDWFYSAVHKATRMGGLRGDLDALGRLQFRPHHSISRAEAAVLYVRATKPHRYALLDVRPSVVGISGPAGIGTGGFVRDDGLILTNWHVAGGTGNKFRVCLCDKDYPPGTERWLVNERKADGTFVDGAYAGFHAGGDGYHDLALVKLSSRQLAEAKARLGGPLPLLRFLDGLPDPAEPVFSFGAPMGRYGWFAAGWVARTNDANGIVECVGLDKAINPGNSGGPVFTLERLVVGIITWKVTGTNVDSMGLAQGCSEVLPWLRAHGVEPILVEDIPDEDETLPLA